MKRYLLPALALGVLLLPALASAGTCERLDPALLKCTGSDGSEWACRVHDDGFWCLDFATGAEWSTDCPECEGNRPPPGSWEGGLLELPDEEAEPRRCDSACSNDCACGVCPEGEVCRRVAYSFCKCAPKPKAPKPLS